VRKTVVVLAVLVLTPEGVATAASSPGSSGPSAGDQQYIDPLAGAGSGSSPSPAPAHKHAPTAGRVTPTPAPVAAPAPAPAAAPVVASAPDSAATLPFTGFPAMNAFAIGVALIGCGLILRRRPGHRVPPQALIVVPVLDDPVAASAAANAPTAGVGVGVRPVGEPTPNQSSRSPGLRSGVSQV